MGEHGPAAELRARRDAVIDTLTPPDHPVGAPMPTVTVSSTQGVAALVGMSKVAADAIRVIESMEDAFGLIPADALAEVRAVLEHGAQRYGARGWETDGRLAGAHVGAADSHICAWDEGEDRDPDSGRHPLAHAAARCLLALALELREGRDG